MVRIKLIIWLILCSVGIGYSQSIDRYVVFFTDKDNTPYNIDSPEKFLSTKAINRPGRIITDEDLPVDPNYINGVINEGGSLIYSLKWFNAAVVEATDSDITTIETLSYVAGSLKVGVGSKPAPGGRFEGKSGGGSNGGRLELVQNELLSAPKMHDDGFMGEGMSIAVFDGGFVGVDQNNYFTHVYSEGRMDMVENIVTGSNDIYSYSPHGSRVLSTIAANIENSYVGIAPNANFSLFVTEDVNSESPIEEYNWALAAERADSAGVDIITSSLSYSTFDEGFTDYTHGDLDGATSIITQAAEKAFSKGIFIVNSAGNYGNKDWINVAMPADGEHVLAVGSIGDDLQVSEFSSTGPVQGGRIKPDVVAVGGPATVISESSEVITNNGTSFSAPQVAGLVAGLWQKYPEMTNQEMFDMIKASSSQANNPDNSYGYGVPNYARFTNQIEGVTAIEDPYYIKEFRLFPNPLSGSELVIEKGEGMNQMEAKLYIYNTTGAIIYHENIVFHPTNKEARISVSSIPAGIYVISIVNNQATKSYKLIRQ